MRAAMDRGPAVGGHSAEPAEASKEAEPVAPAEPAEASEGAEPVALETVANAAIRTGQAIKPILKPSKMY